MASENPRSVNARAHRYPKLRVARLLSRDEKRRRDLVLRCAWLRFGTTEAGIVFLNTENDELGGRPFQVAVGSDGGLSLVTALIGRMPIQPSSGTYE